MDQFLDSWHSYRFRYCSVNNLGLKLESSINEKNHDLIYHVSCEVDENEIENYKLYILQIVGKVGVKVFLQRARYLIRRYMFSNVDVEYVWDTLRYGEKENNSN